MEPVASVAYTEVDSSLEVFSRGWYDSAAVEGFMLDHRMPPTSTVLSLLAYQHLQRQLKRKQGPGRDTGEGN